VRGWALPLSAPSASKYDGEEGADELARQVLNAAHVEGISEADLLAAIKRQTP
jgi:hypothetical protein